MKFSKTGASLRTIARTSFRFRYLFAVSVVIASASLAQPAAAPEERAGTRSMGPAVPNDLSVMTYNVKGLPWPAAWDRPHALSRIAERLAQLRSAGRQPHVVVMQEAFTPEARDVGRIAGYAYQVHGPYLRSEAGVSEAAGGLWYRGETRGSTLDSGLVMLSDFPIVDVRRAAFPTGACAGYDCLAAKGILLVTVDVPGRGAVQIAATHLNSRAAAGVAFERTHEAYRRQTVFISEFLARNRRTELPLVIAGDFNLGRRPARLGAFASAFGSARNGLETVRAKASGGPARVTDQDWIEHHDRDMQLIYNGAETRIEPVSLDVPFGTEPDGTTLSDHMGFTIGYRLMARAKAT